MLNSGDIFAGFRIERLLGQGGMGSVYLARHPRLGKLTALKLLNRELYADREIRTRFEREAEMVAQLDHPNIVEVYDRGTEDAQLWISMQYVDGVDAAGVDVTQLPPERAVQIIEGVASALDYAHSRGVLHRDVKPANIILARAVAGHGERVFLTDFGIARLREDSTHLTQAGMFTATLAYASPEQMTGQHLDHTTDQYSLGCALYWLLIGIGPFDSPHPGELIRGHLQLLPPPVSLRRPGLSPAMDAVITKAMAKRPIDRFPSCSDFAKAARRALTAPLRQIPTPPVQSGPTHRPYPQNAAQPAPPGYVPQAPAYPAPLPGYQGPPAAPPPNYPAPAPQGYPAAPSAPPAPGHPVPGQVPPQGPVAGPQVAPPGQPSSGEPLGYPGAGAPAAYPPVYSPSPQAYPAAPAQPGSLPPPETTESMSDELSRQRTDLLPQPATPAAQQVATAEPVDATEMPVTAQAQSERTTMTHTVAVPVREDGSRSQSESRPEAAASSEESAAGSKGSDLGAASGSSGSAFEAAARVAAEPGRHRASSAEAFVGDRVSEMVRHPESGAFIPERERAKHDAGGRSAGGAAAVSPLRPARNDPAATTLPEARTVEAPADAAPAADDGTPGVDGNPGSDDGPASTAPGRADIAAAEEASPDTAASGPESAVPQEPVDGEGADPTEPSAPAAPGGADSAVGEELPASAGPAADPGAVDAGPAQGSEGLTVSQRVPLPAETGFPRYPEQLPPNVFGPNTGQFPPISMPPPQRPEQLERSQVAALVVLGVALVVLVVLLAVVVLVVGG
ncbi:protein kinase [Nocardia yamanashiensis]|uniref:serine/threonine-protein kinase n=1 Tax=Nocardia yamanashiensis TaxID=209247 RepID=UPI001E3B55B1|nr:serine/threonine-protein kinase [Nocardia yamanashiensis]UGT41967.1 protein kinase [Nocardia yamanashiensis]